MEQIGTAQLSRWVAFELWKQDKEKPALDKLKEGAASRHGRKARGRRKR